MQSLRRQLAVIGIVAGGALGAACADTVDVDVTVAPTVRATTTVRPTTTLTVTPTVRATTSPVAQ